MQKKTIYILIAVVAVVLAIVIAANSRPDSGPDSDTNPTQNSSPQNATFLIDGRSVTLKDGVGVSEEGSTSTRYFGNELLVDLNNDGREDSVFYLTQTTGGSGTFFYVAAAVQTSSGYAGIPAAFVGDRIAPQTINLGIHADPASADAANPIIAANYADRASGEAFTVRPSVGKTLWLRFDVASMQFIEVEPPFEATPPASSTATSSVGTLVAKKWTWVSTTYNDGTKIVPKRAGAFVITFGKAGAFSATTDCNSMGGKYDATERLITFKDTFSTLMFCEASQEADFQKTLGQAASYFFLPTGELVLDLEYDSGSAVFR